VPMGCAAEVAFLDWPRIAVAAWVHLVGPKLLVQESFDWGLFSHAVLPRGTCWHIRTRMREAKRRRFSETALSSCLSLLLADVMRPRASSKQRRLSVLQRRARTSFQIADHPRTWFVLTQKRTGISEPRKAVTAFVLASSSLDCESDWRHRRVGFRVVVVI
jgi:hypothetical protein